MTRNVPATVPGWHSCVLSAAVLVVYLNSFHNAFLWDGLHLIATNAGSKHWNQAPRLFLGELFPQGVLSNYYRPLQALTCLVDCGAWGLSPIGYHLTG